MESIISDLVARFEQGQLSRRHFVGTLAALAASGRAAAASAAEAELDFELPRRPVSIQVPDMQVPQNSIRRCSASR